MRLTGFVYVIYKIVAEGYGFAEALVNQQITEVIHVVFMLSANSKAYFNIQFYRKFVIKILLWMN